ncbi:MAG TPA: c-type cytochrome [Xanthobacteraceae bacterium]|nr:c-type cytochrome [Xanthobacteraceae bacterium]
MIFHPAEALGIRDVSAQGGIVVMRTAAVDLIGTICSRAQAAEPVLVANHTDDAAPASLYTKQQAKDGQQVYAQHCASCHGNMLQGASAPPAGGTAFLTRRNSSAGRWPICATSS